MGAKALQTLKDRYTTECVLPRLASVLTDPSRLIDHSRRPFHNDRYAGSQFRSTLANYRASRASGMLAGRLVDSAKEFGNRERNDPQPGTVGRAVEDELTKRKRGSSLAPDRAPERVRVGKTDVRNPADSIIALIWRLRHAVLEPGAEPIERVGAHAVAVRQT
jgi:hypothetical protein